MSNDVTATLPLSLRERKKLKTRQSIQREAFRLFTERGFDATSVEQIAAAAEISASTFFRYFPTKEDVVLDDDYDSALAEAVRSRPADESVIDALRNALKGALSQMLTEDRADLLFRTRLACSVPSIRARSLEDQLDSQTGIAAVIADRAGRDPEDLEVKCAAAAIIAVATAVVWHWAEQGGEEDLTELYDRQLGLLATGLRL
jgi:AcrR family transcriptional regulator